MANTVFPSQVGFVPSGINQNSQVVFGRNITGSWEAIGVGQGGRPDILQQITAYIVNIQGNSATLPIIINIDTTAVQQIISSNSHAPQVFNFSLQEVSTCETDDAGNSTEMRRMALLSQAYLPQS
jgi:hypothetical protein